MRLSFSGPLWFWRGPSPFHFVTVPDEQSGMIEVASGLVSYGWGMVPVSARIGATTWTTSLWPKDGGYIVPIKADIRRAEKLELDDVVMVELTVDI